MKLWRDWGKLVADRHPGVTQLSRCTTTQPHTRPDRKKRGSGDIFGISYRIYLRHSSPPDYYMFRSTGKRFHKDGAVFCRCARAASVARCKFMSLFTVGKSIPASLAPTCESNTVVLQQMFISAIING